MWQIEVVCSDFWQVHAGGGRGDVVLLGAGYVRPLLSGEGRGPLFRADFELLSEGIFAGPEAPSGSFADDDDWGLPIGLTGCEVAALNDGNAERAKVVWGDKTISSDRRFIFVNAQGGSRGGDGSNGHPSNTAKWTARGLCEKRHAGKTPHPVNQGTTESEQKCL